MDGTRPTGAQREQRAVISLTRHARRRSARRNVALDAVEYVLAYGRMVRRTGVMFYFLGRRDIPACDRCASWATRLEGTIVVVAPDGGVITVYRNRHGLRSIERKMKYRLFERKTCAGREEYAEADEAAADSADSADDGEPRIPMTTRASA